MRNIAKPQLPGIFYINSQNHKGLLILETIPVKAAALIS